MSIKGLFDCIRAHHGCDGRDGPQGTVTLQELVVSTLATADALAKLLIEKGLIIELSLWPSSLQSAQHLSGDIQEVKERGRVEKSVTVSPDIS